MARRLNKVKAEKSGSGVMEGDGQELWRLVRPSARAAGPLKVLRRIGPDGYLHDRIPQVVEQLGAKRVLQRLHVNAKPVDVADAAWEALADLATPRKRLSLSQEAATRVALDVLDACARLPEDNPGARLAGSVVEVIGTLMASMQFDGGLPGSGQVLTAWRVGKRIFLTGDEADAFAVCSNLNQVLAWWSRNWEWAEIDGSGLKASVMEAVGLVRSDDDSWGEGGSFRINGRIWRRQTAGEEP